MAKHYRNKYGFSCVEVEDRTLDLFVSQKFHWNKLTPNQMYSIASELQQHRDREKMLNQEGDRNENEN
jgi:hypothetical protein